MIKSLIGRLFYLLIGSVFSIIPAFALSLMWTAIKGFVLGYGDSGPEWVGTVTNTIITITVITCIVLSQFAYNHIHKKTGQTEKNVSEGI
ncbi:MAG: hypothetical protein H8D23_05425 [Candidatus Brocadiales bacterium]|nr:hypothetical protein [Candidatus Brocadiales bacterium]